MTLKGSETTTKGAKMNTDGMVAKCTAADCIYNQKSRCLAESIVMAVDEDAASCQMYSPEVTKES